jgi:hypothetical protein
MVIGSRSNFCFCKTARLRRRHLVRPVGGGGGMKRSGAGGGLDAMRCDAEATVEVAVSKTRQSFPLISGLWPQRPLVELPLALQLRVMQAAGVAERSCAVRAAPPFRRVDPVAAVTPPGRSRALSGENVSKWAWRTRGTWDSLHHAVS